MKNEERDKGGKQGLYRRQGFGEFKALDKC